MLQKRMQIAIRRRNAPPGWVGRMHSKLAPDQRRGRSTSHRSRRTRSRRTIRGPIAAALTVAAAALSIAAYLAAPRKPAPTTTAAQTRHIAEPSIHGDGAIPDGEPVTPFDVGNSAIANLDPNLRTAIRRAAIDARNDGVDLRITSGWRSARYQQVLLDRTISRYGSAEIARQYVNTPRQSTHVAGKAVDVGPTDADSWLSQHGRAYGLCQIYANEMWHFELATAPGGTCPELLANAAGG